MFCNLLLKYKEVNPLKCLLSEGFQTPNYDSVFTSRIPSKSLTQQRFTAIIKRNKGEQDLVDTLKSQRKIFKLLDRIFIMYDFNVKGDLGRHILSISGASSECGISTSTINREIEKGTFPPKQKISGRRIGFFVYQIEQWLKGKRGGWN